MNKPKRYLVLLLLCTFLAACRIDAESILKSNESLVVSIYKSSGTAVTKEQINKGDETYSQLEKWLSENEKGWEPSPVTFAPSVEVRGKKFVINFHPTLAIINFQSPDGNYHQYVKDIKESEFQYLLQ